MTVSATLPVSGPHIADGVNRDWPFTFKITDAAHMVLHITDADGTNGVDITNGFTIAPQYLNEDTGGTVVYPISPAPVLAAGKIVTPYRSVPYDQMARIGNQGAYLPETHERALDHLAMQIQQLDERIQRALKVPLGTSIPDNDELITAILELIAVIPELTAVAAISGDIEAVAALAVQIQMVVTNMAAILAAPAAAAAAEQALEDIQELIAGIGGPLLDTANTIADLAASATPRGTLVMVRGFHSVDDGAPSLWRKSDVKGVRGRAMAEAAGHSGGAALPSGEYKVPIIGGGGAGGTARVLVRTTVVSSYSPLWSTGAADTIVNAIVWEPGEGYTDANPLDLPRLSQVKADWRTFHSNDIAVSFPGGETMPNITFALADNRMSIRTAAGEEFLRVHDGVIPARSLGVRCTMFDERFEPAAVDTGADTITVASNVKRWSTGKRVTVGAVTGALPSPLVAGTYYWLRRASPTLVSLHATLAGALADTGRIDLTTAGTGTLVITEASDDDRQMQEAVLAVLRGRTQIVHQYGGAVESGATILFPHGTVGLNGSVIYINSTGTPTGSEVTSVGIVGSGRPSPRPGRPDTANGGTQFQYGILSFGDETSDSGVFEYVSRGINVSNFGIIGGIRMFAIQHAFKFDDVLVNPDYPVGQVFSGVRTAGYGVVMRHCSTAVIARNFVTSGDQVYFGNNNELSGWLVTDCDQLNFIGCAGSFCRVGWEFTYGSVGEKNTNIKCLSCTAEANKREDVIIEACRVFEGAFTTLGRNQQDSTLPRVRVGAASPDSACYAIKLRDGSYSGTPYLNGHEVVSTISTDRVQVFDDYSHRYVNGETVIIANDSGALSPAYSIRTIANVSYASGTRLTTINVTAGVDTDVDTIVKVGNEVNITASNVNATTVRVAGSDVTGLFGAGDWCIVNRSVGGNFAAKVVSSSFSGGNTDIVVNIAQVNANVTTIKPVKPTNAAFLTHKAIYLSRVTGWTIDNNSIVNFDRAVEVDLNAIRGNYLRGDWNGAAGDEVVSLSALNSEMFETGFMTASLWSSRGTRRLPPASVTIAVGVATATGELLRVDTQGLTATDDLDTILLAGGRTPLHGERIKVELTVTGRKPTLTTAGNMVGAALPLQLISQAGFVALEWNQPVGKWVVTGSYPG